MEADSANRLSPIVTRRGALRRLLRQTLATIGTTICGGSLFPALLPPGYGARSPSRSRLRIRAGPVKYPGAGATLQGYLARPWDNDPGSGMILVFADPGIAEHVRNAAIGYARSGFVVLAMDLYSRYGNAALFSTPAAARQDQNTTPAARAAADVQAAHQYLLSFQAVRAGSIRVEHVGS